MLNIIYWKGEAKMKIDKREIVMRWADKGSIKLAR